MKSKRPGIDAELRLKQGLSCQLVKLGRIYMSIPHYYNLSERFGVQSRCPSFPNPKQELVQPSHLIYKGCVSIIDIGNANEWLYLWIRFEGFIAFAIEETNFGLVLYESKVSVSTT